MSAATLHGHARLCGEIWLSTAAGRERPLILAGSHFMQPTLFLFFNPAKKKTVSPTSPLTKQAAAIRTLKRVSRRDADDDDFKLDERYMKLALEIPPAIHS
jgi:hypothetical protein